MMPFSPVQLPPHLKNTHLWPVKYSLYPMGLLIDAYQIGLKIIIEVHVDRALNPLRLVSRFKSQIEALVPTVL